MTPLDVLRRTARPILEYGRGWMADRATYGQGLAIGLEQPFSFWVNGRAGVMGDVDADLAAAAIGFMEPSMVRKMWEGRPADLTPGAASLAYRDAAAEWGRGILADHPTDELTELVSLAERIASAANPSVGILFAGWRNLPLPGDPPGAATVVLNVLRELRGGAHLSAVQAAGIGPVGAIISADDQVRGGPAGAARFGWPEPHPDPDTERRRIAEDLTDAICLPAYETLSEAEGARFVELVTAIRAAAGEIG